MQAFLINDGLVGYFLQKEYEKVGVTELNL